MEGFMMQIPTILSGPIIRRVEPTKIYIWIATSKEFQLDAALYKVISEKSQAIPTY